MLLEPGVAVVSLVQDKSAYVPAANERLVSVPMAMGSCAVMPVIQHRHRCRKVQYASSFYLNIQTHKSHSRTIFSSSSISSSPHPSRYPPRLHMCLCRPLSCHNTTTTSTLRLYVIPWTCLCKAISDRGPCSSLPPES